MKRKITFKKVFRAGTKLFSETITSIPLRLFIGPKLGVNHVWPPSNYTKRYSSLHYYFIERPLALRGVFLPKRSPKDGNAFKTFNNEHKIIDRLIQSSSNPISKYFVDIGAGDGIDMSNTYLLAANGWRGLSLEIDVNKFAMMAATYQYFPSIDLVRARVTPKNVIDLLDYAETPKDFGVLNIDIDGYDYYVLEEILKKYRPQIIAAEINPIIPLSVNFSVKYNESFIWAGNNWFQGMSLAMLKVLADKNNYKIVDVYGHAAFLMPNEISETIPTTGLEELDKKIALTAYDDIDPILRKELNDSPKKALDHVSNTLFGDRPKDSYFAEAAKKA